MLAREFVLEAVKSGRRKSECLDLRDFKRLCDFFPTEEWEHFGFRLKEGAETPPVKEWTEENIKAELAEDLEFAFEKALGQRGISSALMYQVVKMWLWILEDPLADFDDYFPYGLPLFKAVAAKYNLPDPTRR